MSEIIIYEDAEGQSAVQVRLDGETVWLTQKQMADLFESGTDNIGLHLKNIYAEGELSEPTATEEYSVVQTEGKRQVTFFLPCMIAGSYRLQIRHYGRRRSIFSGIGRRCWCR